ncbi:hypothetical protein AB0P17_04430 [Streptomyces sp. NPDC088124]|uniref:hypothetical protein n=1 Tax=Streptomyces sp. NPDC088124 TaxID=3154654 RepID=UPI00343C06C9
MPIWIPPLPRAVRPGGDGSHARRDGPAGVQLSARKRRGTRRVLDRVKELALSPDGLHATTKNVAAYFEVSENAIWAVIHDHRSELHASGYRVLSGEELTYFKQVCGLKSRSRSLGIFSRRAVLNIAMLLRDSIVARQVRTYLLDSERSHSLSLWIT